jgi:serine/threonine-protein kinase
LKANQSTPRVPFIDSSAGQPDCDKISTVPLPAGGSLEGESGYTCSSGGDCHLIVLDTDSKLLYEIWSSSLVSGTLHGTCAIVWDTNKNYWPASDRTFQSKGRGDQCTSADAAGFPISALITSADQVADAIQSGRGDVGHAQRFILPNSTMRSRSFIHPATHAGAPSNSDTNAVPYGALLRLKSSFNVAALPNEAARVIARSLQRYGMYLADGGNIAMNLQDDSTTTHKWSEWGFSQTDLQSFKPSDFEMMPGGQPIALTYDCVRAQ